MTPRQRFLDALRGKTVDRPPVWLMRQAGRYLPEYRDIQAKSTFEERLRDPELAATITLQPLGRFDVDAAVIFSDILVPVDAMGRGVRYTDAGPVLDRPVQSPDDVADLVPPDPRDAMPYVLDAIRLVRERADDRALIGFAAAPFTMAAYLVEGGASKDFHATKAFAFHHPEAWDQLVDVCARAAGAHLVAQARAGCDALQLFDTWAEVLSPAQYARLVGAATRDTIRTARQSGAPVIYFAKGIDHLAPVLGAIGADAWSIDWRVDPDVARPGLPLQGNLDPAELLAPVSHVKSQTLGMLERFAGRPHVANLGHGVLPQTPVENVKAFVDTVTSWTP